MSSAELALTLMVALIVFGPNKLPMLAEHLGRLYRLIKTLRFQLHSTFDQLIKEQTLLDNQKKADEADKHY